jgi:nicotinate dehydrogenase subunit B
VREPATPAIGYMPAFRHALDDRQVADIAAALRARHAPGKPPWPELEAQVARVRSSAH